MALIVNEYDDRIQVEIYSEVNILALIFMVVSLSVSSVLCLYCDSCGPFY